MNPWMRWAIFVLMGVNIGLAAAQSVLMKKNTDLHHTLEDLIARANKAAGCDGTEPKVVPYHDGMTLCPGQSAQLPPIVIPPPESNSGTIHIKPGGRDL